MADDIVVYNLEDSSQVELDTATAASSSQASSSSSTSTASSSSSSASTTPALTETDIRGFIKSELSNFSGQFRRGSTLSNQVFVLDDEGLKMGSSDIDSATFSVTYDGVLTASGAIISGTFSSSNYVSGSSGWTINSNGFAEFEDITARGVIRTSVFEKDTVSAVGGQLLVTSADALDADMTALDSSTLTIRGETTFAANDILHIKDGTDEEYLRVTSAASAPTYSVTRDLAAAYSADNNPAWKTGTAVVKEGSSDGASTYSGGWLRLLGEGTNSPRYSVFKRTGVAYNATTEYVGLGNVNGLLDYSSDTFGIVIGTTTDGYLAFDPDNGLRLKGDVTAENINYSPNQFVALLQVGTTEIPAFNNCFSLTTHGRYLLIPFNNGGTSEWRIWDTRKEYLYNYTRNASITRTSLSILPTVNCTVVSGTTEYILAFAAGGTTCYRYDADGQNETSVSFSGTAITTGARRIGFDPTTGYVYIMDGASLAATTIKRYTFASTTLTYVDTVTLSVAPASAGSTKMWIGATNLVLVDAFTNSSRATYQRYGKNSGTQTTSVDWGHGTTGVSFVGLAVRTDDNALLHIQENDTGSGTTSIIQKIYMD